MAKICIIEDDLEDAKKRYGFLARTSHEIHTVFDGVPRMIAEILWKAEGFDMDKVSYKLDDLPEADVYFVDGLRGYCFYVAEQAGKDRTYINSTNSEINERAIKEGFRTVGGKSDIERIISDLS